MDRPIAPAPSRPTLPGGKEVLTQAYHDWFGKDVQETPTVSYVWTADQFGHFGLGFQITYLLSWIAIWVGLGTRIAFFACAAVNLAIWIVKEVLDYVREVKRAKQARSDFPFNGTEVAWNAFTAVFYIAVGIVVAGAALVVESVRWQPIVAFLALLVPSLGIGYWWLRRKVTFQQAGLPYLYRLANFPINLDEPETVKRVRELCDPRTSAGRHVVISGLLNAGKTSFAVGIGTEFAFALGIGRYTTLAKLLEARDRFAVRKVPQRDFDDGRVLWPWDAADLLIVDDVDVLSSEDNAQSRAELEAALREALAPGLPLRDRRSVWVIGDVDEPQAWRDALARAMGLPDGARNPLLLIELKITVKAALAAKA